MRRAPSLIPILARLAVLPLGYFAFRCFRGAFMAPGSGAPGIRALESRRTEAAQGFLVQIFNPNPHLFFAGIGVPLLRAQGPAFAVAFLATVAAVKLALAVFATPARSFQSRHRRVWLTSCGLAYATFALILVLRAPH